MKTFKNIINNEKLTNYKFRRIKGIIGLIKSYFSYKLNNRKDNFWAYSSYFIVKQITGKDPLENE